MGIIHRQNGIESFFEPRSVAIIGASRTPGKGGYNIVENLLKLGYTGDIYPINPRTEKLLGLKVYSTLQDTPETPDLAMIVLPPEQVMISLNECAVRGIRAVIVESAGFGEMDENGAKVEKQMIELAGRAGMRIMGPNSVGTINSRTGFDASLGRLHKLFLPKTNIVSGNVGFVCQTGLITGVYLPLINTELGISKAACLGNKCDVDESDMLEYLSADPQTRILAMYLESIKDGRRFMEISRRTVKEKPILIFKAAVTGQGARASATHTGSIAGEDRVYDAAFSQAGIIRVQSFDQLWDFTRAFVYSPLPAGKRMAIVNLAGSGCVTAVDACIRYGFEIAELSAVTVEKIRKIYPDWWHVRSPVDVWTAVELSGFEVAFTTATRAVMEDDNVDAVVVVMGAIDWITGKEVPELFREIRTRFPQKPLMVVNPLGDRQIYARMCRGFQSLGIPSYTSDEGAITAMAALYRYRDIRRSA